MDIFGIGTAIRGTVGVYFLSARRSGRTVQMINTLKDGDRVVFATSNMARTVERMARDRGVKIEYIVVNPIEPHP